MMYALIGGGVLVTGMYVLGFALCWAGARADQTMEHQRIAELPQEWENTRLRDMGIIPPQHHIPSARAEGWMGAAPKRNVRRPTNVAGA